MANPVESRHYAMQLIRYPGHRAKGRRPTALAIGNFDGLHRGHKALVTSVCARADELTPALMCFEPLPASVFRPEQPVPRLLGPRDKIRLARDLGIEALFMMHFTPRFAALSPDEFIRQVILDTANAGLVVVGPDFRFGRRAAGDVSLLKATGQAEGFDVRVIDEVSQAGERISSSAIRAALGAGRLDLAAEQLGRPYRLSGRVLRGQQLGRTLGYPTVNLRPPDPPALAGVAAVRVAGAGLHRHPGVASLGLRPTVAGRGWLLEVHLFDYAGDLYGRHLEVEFVEYLRPEKKFDSLDAMTRQMGLDAAAARRILGAEPSAAAMA
ncbi:MAG: bifunctional riboflavin kinase/FAD synthetase [Wenzhouxiangella sp.]